MKLLFILTYVPWPLNCGGNQAMFNMINALRTDKDISILCYLRNHSDIKAYEELKRIWPDVTFYSCSNKDVSGPAPLYEHAVPETMSCRIFNYVQHSMERKIRRRMRKGHLKSIILREEAEDYLKENSTLFHIRTDFPPEFQKMVWEVSRKGFDVVQVEFYESMSLVYLLPDNVKKVFVHHEIRYIRNENELSLFNNVRPDEIARFRYLKDIENMTLAKYDHVIVLTEVDKQILSNDNPGLNLYVSPAVVALPDRLMKFSKSNNATRKLAFIGSGNHFPNADGMLWFCTNILPLLEDMEVSLEIVGVWRKKIRQKLLSINPRIKFTGFVDDLSTYLNDKISIVPIRIGSGMRMKILDSIVAASPIITTSKGCEGMPFTDGEDYCIADTPEEFAETIKTLLADVSLQERLAVNIQRKMKEVFDFEHMKQRRMAFYDMIK